MGAKRVLVLGATGAMGQYLVPILADMGHDVTAVALDQKSSDRPNVHYIAVKNAKEMAEYARLLGGKYDGIVDFLIYPTGELPWTVPNAAASTGHYIYLSTYRIYANEEVPIKETSPRLIDASPDVILRNSDDYCIYKARGENILRSLPSRNWTIVRPAITYSFMRYQLTTLEAFLTVARAFAGKQVAVPVQARDCQATMSWGGDVAMMLARLLFNDKALGETFTVSTSEHHTWGQIAEYYRDICNLQAVWVDKEDYLRIFNGGQWDRGARWQLEYDRLFERVIDNSKVLAATGMRQTDLKKLHDGLKYEIGRCPRDAWENCQSEYTRLLNQRMDECLAGNGVR